MTVDRDALIRGIVKGLVWEDDGSHRHVAVAGAETFIIADMWRAVRGSGFSYRGQAFPTLAAAQAAAEADYRARFAAALDMDALVELVGAAKMAEDQLIRLGYDGSSSGLTDAIARIGGRG